MQESHNKKFFASSIFGYNYCLLEVKHYLVYAMYFVKMLFIVKYCTVYVAQKRKTFIVGQAIEILLINA
jgi:hypothetical protein